jgi:exosortase
MLNPIATTGDVHERSVRRTAASPTPPGVYAIALRALLLTASFGLLYFHVAAKLLHDFANDDNASHGFLIVPLAAYLAWERRKQLADLAPRPSGLGLLVVMASVGLLVAGTLGSELFLARISMIGVLAGSVLFLFGRAHLRVLAFPIAFLLLMIPLPALIFNQIALPLQLLASRVGEMTLTALAIPVLREGNVIVLAHTSLEVVEACSGIRSLAALITLAVVYAYFSDQRTAVRVPIVLSSVPIAVIANAIRVAGTGVAAQFYGPGVAEGFFHTFSGWVMFVVAFAALLGVRSALLSLVRLAERWNPVVRVAA